jgi:hypothetical protein
MAMYNPSWIRYIKNHRDCACKECRRQSKQETVLTDRDGSNTMNDTHKHPKGAGKSSFELINTKILADILPVKPGSVVLAY